MTAKKRALGRGLDALIRPPEPPVRELALDSLQPNRQQPREAFDDEALAELAGSIREQGIVQPLVVTAGADDGRYRIVAGERRWRAARLAGLERVPVVVREVDGERAMLEIALVENLQRSDLNPIEEAGAYDRLQREFGLSQEQVAGRVGKSRSAVANTLRLLKLPGEVRELLRDGRLTAGQARPLLALEDAAEQVRVARRAADEGLTARELEARASRRKGGRARKKGREPDADTAAAAERLCRRLQTRVEIQRRGRGGWVRLAFHSEDELIRLYDMLMAAGERR